MFLVRQLAAWLQCQTRTLPALPSNDADIRFLVVIPTIRPEAMTPMLEQLMPSFTYPTDLVILNGSAGKVQALNTALRQILRPQQHTFLATLDDDLWMPHNWQQTVVNGFRALPKVGLLGIDYDPDHPDFDITGGQTPIKAQGDIHYRYPVCNVPGGNMVVRTEMALAMGAIPAMSDVGYCHYDDGWRCRQVSRLGYEAVLLCPEEKVTLLAYPEDPNYLAKKETDLTKSRHTKRVMLQWWRLYVERFMTDLVSP